LRKRRIPHQVLNAKQHEKEAEIIKNAGQYNAITIATNMAGRGTDIKLSPDTLEAGGLFILGTERHESRRIDNQLRGRAGRQGDKGISQFFISMEDNLPKLFGSDKIKSMMNTLGIPDNMPIENKMVSNAIENAQKRVEGHNFDIRKHILEYDDVLNKQRTKIYDKRKRMLMSDSIHSDIVDMISNESAVLVNSSINAETGLPNTETLEKLITKYTGAKLAIKKSNNNEDIIEDVEKILQLHYSNQQKNCNDDNKFCLIEKHIALRSIDSLWMDHIDRMSHLREEVSLQGYGQRDPLQIYKHESYNMFVELMSQLQTNTVITLFHITYEQEPEIKEQSMKNIKTNEGDIEANTSSSSTFMGRENQASKSVNILSEQKIGRNDPCPCGSGKKFKKCHGKD
jgi:preprotein translocase subunit SecA